MADIKRHVLATDAPVERFKTIECSIMDIADDVAYSTYDLEDDFKAGFLTPMGLFAQHPDVYEAVAETIGGRIEKQYPEKSDFVVDGDLVRSTLRGIFDDMLFRSSSESDQLLADGEVDLSTKRFVIGAEVQALSRKLAADGYGEVSSHRGWCDNS